MPFKGDMRLGGPHDNEVGLRGSSEGNGEGFPPYGTFHQTLTGQEYPITEGGASFYFYEGYYDVPSQICDVDELHDGAGGYFIDWSTATNVSFVEEGTLFYEGPEFGSDPVEIPSESGIYWDSAMSKFHYQHDGIGGYIPSQILAYYLNGEVSSDLRVPYDPAEINGEYYGTGKYDTYVWNGDGTASLAVNQGSYYPNGTVVNENLTSYYEFELDGVFYPNGKYETYLWNGSGSAIYTTNLGSYYPNGASLASVSEIVYFGEPGYETNADTGRTLIYTWNGNGGANTPSVSGQYYPSGTLIGYYGPTQTPLEVPSNQGAFYDSEATKYTWNGQGGVNNLGFNYYPNGTFITSDNDFTYYWDGNGSYYSEPI